LRFPVAGAIGVTRFISKLLFGVASLDPLTFGIAAVVLTAVGLAACWVPARRATRVDPLMALRAE
jgi:ABC-type antimicrobial peptide transport system permease subunit